MADTHDFTTGKITGPLIRFALPVLFALFLQAMYGAVDLIVVGHFAGAADLSAVSTGSQIMTTLTNLISSFAMGTTIFLGMIIGQGRKKEGGPIIGASIFQFILIGIAFTLITVLAAPQIAGIMQAPEEAFPMTVAYLRICGAGFLVIIAYNLIGSIFRGMGDSRTPLITVAIACVCNIFGDLLLVGGFGLGAAGAAAATVFAQVVSVIASVFMIKRQKLPFTFDRQMIRWNSGYISKITRLGLPIALQDLLVGISFLIILAIVNSISLTASAGVGAAEKVCTFIMLVPSAFMQSMSAFVAQNRGAGRMDRASRALLSGILVSEMFGVCMFYLGFFHGDLLIGLFSSEQAVISAGADYLKSYAIDCMLTSFLFCFIGYFNGCGETKFVMAQGIIGAFGVRVPVSWFMSRIVPVSLFRIGLATPCSSSVQILLSFIWLAYMKKREKRNNNYGSIGRTENS